MRTWLRQRCESLVFWIGILGSVGGVCVGYSSIRESQVQLDAKICEMDRRISRIESQVDKLLDMHIAATPARND